MGRRKGVKRILTIGLISISLLSLVGVAIIIGAVVDQNMKVLLFKRKANEVAMSNGDLPNLPPFITEEMMQAFFSTQEQYGIPVSTGIAQLIAESGFGKYGPHGESGQGLSGLAYNDKNLFGIKYWSGDKNAVGERRYSTSEQTSSGNSYGTVAGFSIYPTYTACINQRGVMLSKAPYYQYTIAQYKNNCDGKYTISQANAFMSGIRQAGWATDIRYVQTCLSFMQQYNLYVYDNMNWGSYQSQLNGSSGSGESVIVGQGFLCNPCPTAYISSEFGGRASPGGIGSTNHKGRDYAAASGSGIYAAADGVVERAEFNTARGYYLLIDHGNGLKTIYQHCSVLQARVGQRIKKGQRIASVGSTGYSTGPHLHFEVWVNNVPVDPRRYL